MIKNIQALRAIAAYMVVFYHVAAGPGVRFGVRLPLDFGRAGVDIFFVVSGFIMVFVCRSRETSARRFLLDRIVRVVPLYWVATFGMLLLFELGFRPSGLHLYDLGDVVRSMFFLPNVRADGIAGPILSAGWTLNFEMLFYILFSVLLLLNRNRTLLVGPISIFGSLVVVGLIARPSSRTLTFLTDSITLEFVLGCLLAHWYLAKRTSGLPGRLLGIGLLVVGSVSFIVGQMVGLSDLNPAWDSWRFVLLGLPAVCVVLGALVLEESQGGVASKFLQDQGSSSYSLYLFHPFAIQPAARLIHWVLPFEGVVMAWVGVGLTVAAAVVVGTLVHRLVEVPLGRFIKEQRRRGAPVPAQAE